MTAFLRAAKPARRAAVAPACPAGHPVTDPEATRCPTCGRLLLRRIERICSNGHVVSSPDGTCPFCGEAPAPDRALRYLFLGTLFAFALFAVLVVVMDLPQRLIEWGRQIYQWIVDFVANLPELIG